jgi:hypothetical protein
MLIKHYVFNFEIYFVVEIFLVPGRPSDIHRSSMKHEQDSGLRWRKTALPIA